jgi:hypothetical protein
MAVLSPARLSADELRGAVGVARAEPDVRAQIAEPGPRAGKLLVYVLPETWSIAELPLDPPSAATHPGTDRGHRVLSFAKTSSARQVVDLSASSNHNRGS